MNSKKINTNKIQINKLDDNKKKTFKNRIIVSIFVIVYLLLLISISFLFDWTPTNFWDEHYPKDSLIQKDTLKGIFALFYIFLIYIPYYIALYEVGRLFFSKKNRLALSLILLSGSIFFLIPNILYIIFKIFNVMSFQQVYVDNVVGNKQIELNKLRFFYSSFFICFLINIIVVNSLLNGYKIANATNVITANFLMFIVPFGFLSFALIGIIKSWLSLVFVLIAVTSTDSFCYLSGLFFGKHKMTPNVSPNKTWEGAILGSISAFIICMIFSSLLLLNQKDLIKEISIIRSDVNYINWIWIICTSISIILLSIIGDLSFSYIKRKFDIKDFGFILKSHGGILDRFDSLIFSSSIYIAILFVGTSLVEWSIFS